MEQIIELFGHGKNLTILQMSCRGVLVFLITLILIRISGRRSFGLKTPLDNIIVLLLGAMLSRAVAGVSPFWPVVVTSFVIVALHRIFGWLLIHSQAFANLVEGSTIELFKDGRILRGNLNKALLREADVLQGVRNKAQTEDLEKIDKVYFEQNGDINVVKKSE